MRQRGYAWLLGICGVVLVWQTAVFAAAPDAVIEVYVDKPTVVLPETLYGVFYEDINHAADGGLYAELVWNRSFANYAVGKTLAEGNEDPRTGRAWRVVVRGGGSCAVTVENADPLNANNTEYVQLKIANPGSGVGVANAGFRGIYVEKGATYDFSFYARRSESHGTPFTIAIEGADGKPLGTALIKKATRDWRKYETSINVSGTDEKARLVVTTEGRGDVCMDMISLLPRKTFKGRKNGLRPDLAQVIADLKPGVFRFPGGCIAHGAGLANAYRWKDTIGDVAERKGNWNLWGYHQSYGLGYYEYFLFCEDIGAEPLPVLPVGVSCGFRGFQAAPMEALQPWIDDALDLVEFANGAPGTKWGGVRASMGHPRPFNMKYVCLGNEEHDTREFRERLPHFVKALREKHPEIKIIGTSGLGPGIPLYENMYENRLEISDEHYYEAPQWFIRNRNRFDSFDRDKPKVFVGEYASGGNSLFNAVAEAVYLTGIERNADMVPMTAYAPTYARYGFTQWGAANLVWFDHRTVVRTPSYHVQYMFSCNRGDRYLENAVTYSPKETRGIGPAWGRIGVGTWATQAEFDDIKVSAGGNVLFEESFDAGSAKNWSPSAGTFELRNGAYAQMAGIDGAVSLWSKPVESDEITYSLRARKTGGAEGFLILFGQKDNSRFYWWNIAGWGNSRHGIEKGAGSYIMGKESLASRNGKIETGVWYDIRIEIDGKRIKCFLNNELIHDVADENESVLAVSAAEDHDRGEVILKIANTLNVELSAEVRLNGVRSVGSRARAWVMSGNPGDMNDLDAPDRIIPQTMEVPADKTFTCTVPGCSVQVVRVKVNK